MINVALEKATALEQELMAPSSSTDIYSAAAEKKFSLKLKFEEALFKIVSKNGIIKNFHMTKDDLIEKKP